MSGLRGTAKFRTLAAETTQALNDRGLDVLPLVVNDLLESGAQRLAEQIGVFTDRGWPNWVLTCADAKHTCPRRKVK